LPSGRALGSAATAGAVRDSSTRPSLSLSAVNCANSEGAGVSVATGGATVSATAARGVAKAAKAANAARDLAFTAGTCRRAQVVDGGETSALGYTRGKWRTVARLEGAVGWCSIGGAGDERTDPKGYGRRRRRRRHSARTYRFLLCGGRVSQHTTWQVHRRRWKGSDWFCRAKGAPWTNARIAEYDHRCRRNHHDALGSHV